MAKKRTTPELNLTPELPEVVSRDFNLFFKPDAEPEIAGLKEFTRSLDNFVNDAGTKLVLGEELEQKKIPFIIRRPLPSGGSEYWHLRDLEVI